jgi:hypothetical protein
MRAAADDTLLLRCHRLIVPSAHIGQSNVPRPTLELRRRRNDEFITALALSDNEMDLLALLRSS